MHLRHLGSHMTVHPPVRPSAPQAYQCKIIQLRGIATQMELEVFGVKSHGQLDLERKNNNNVKSFFD